MVMSEKVGAIKSARDERSDRGDGEGGGAIPCSRGDPSCGEDGAH